MPKFTFVCEHLDHYTYEIDSKTTTEFTKESLDDVIENFELFLKGAGFVFDGHLEFITDKPVDSLFTDEENEINDWNDSFDVKFDDLDHGAAQPTLNVELDDFEIKIESSTPSSATWPFPANERPQ